MGNGDRDALLDDERVDCATMERLPPERLTLEQRREQSQFRGRFERAFSDAGGDIGRGGWTRAGPKGFWAGTPKKAPEYFVVDSENGIRLRVRPVGCGVYRLRSNADELSSIYGDIEARLELRDSVPLTATVTAKDRLLDLAMMDDSVTAIDGFSLWLDAPLLELLSRRVASQTPGPSRLALLESANRVLQPASMVKLGKQFQPTPEERYLVDYGDPQSFAVAGRTTIIGTMPMSVALDGVPLAVEPMPMSASVANPPQRRSGVRIGRVVIDGAGVGRLTVETRLYQEPDIIFTYGPDTMADFTHERFDMRGPDGWGTRPGAIHARCVYAPVRTTWPCLNSGPAGQPALPHDYSCLHRFDARVGQLGEIGLVLPSGVRPLKFLLLTPGAIVLDDVQTTVTATRSKRPCPPAPE